MLYSIDCETTGLEIKHGCRPFYVSMACEDGTTITFGDENDPWRVDPLTRKVTPSKADLKELLDLLNDPQNHWVFHNSLFDVTALKSVLPKLDDIGLLRRCDDTLLMSHFLDNLSEHSLKSLAIRHLNISDFDQQQLQSAVNKCRTIASRLGWAIASLTTFPYYKRAPKQGWWPMDMWLPQTLVQHGKLSPEEVEVMRSVLKEYATLDAVRTLGLYYVFLQHMQTQFSDTSAYADQLRTLIPIHRVQQVGISVHSDRMLTGLNRLEKLIETHRKKAVEVTGNPDFNIRSSKQKSELLYTTFGMPVTKVTKKGKPSTDKDVLSTLLSQTIDNPKSIRHQWAYHVTCASRCMTNIQYIDAYLRHQIDGKLYPSFHPVGTDTTRLSSSNPNGQNVGKGGDPFIAKLYDPAIIRLLKEPSTKKTINLLQTYQEMLDHVRQLDLSCRQFFGPEKGREWYSVDYKQLQLVIFAFTCGEGSMIEAFRKGMDFHDFMARKIFDVPPDRSPTEAERRVAKNVNFGFIFGAGEEKIEHTAQRPGLFIILRQLFPAAIQFIESNKKKIRTQGFIDVAGYHLHVDKAKPYAATNYLVQGYEGRIVKRAMQHCSEYLESTHSGDLVLNVHDELIFDFPLNTGEHHIGTLCNLMEQAGREFGVECEVDAKYIVDRWDKGIPVEFSV